MFAKIALSPVLWKFADFQPFSHSMQGSARFPKKNSFNLPFIEQKILSFLIKFKQNSQISLLADFRGCPNNLVELEPSFLTTLIVFMILRGTSSRIEN